MKQVKDRQWISFLVQIVSLFYATQNAHFRENQCVATKPQLESMQRTTQK